MSQLKVDSIVNAAANGPTAFPFGTSAEFNVPLRLYGSTPADSRLHVGPAEPQNYAGVGQTKQASGFTPSFPLTTIDFQTGAVVGGPVNVTFPSVTAGQYIRAALQLNPSNQVDVLWSAAAVSHAALADPSTLLTGGSLGIGWIDLVGTGTTTFKTASALSVSASNIIEAAPGGSPAIHQIVGSGGGAGSLADLSDVNTAGATDGQALVYESGTWVAAAGGDSSFQLSTVTSPTGLILGGRIQTDDGHVLVSGTGTDTLTTGVALTVNFDTILGASPAVSTPYWLYIDANSLGSPVVLTDTGQPVYCVVQANLRLLTLDPTQVNPNRYYSIGSLKTDPLGGWAHQVSTPKFRAPFVGEVFSSGPYEYSAALTTEGLFVLTHNLQAAPQVINFYYDDGTFTTQLDPQTVLQDRTATTLTVSTVGQTLTGTQQVIVEAFYFVTNTNFSVSSRTFTSPWYTDTSVTTVPHLLSDMDDIRGYIVQIWDLTVNGRSNAYPPSLVAGYDNTNIYLNWAGYSPSPILQYRVCTGTTALPGAIPSQIGGFTRFVGFGPGSYPTLTAALATCVSGDAILVNKGYAVTGPEVVSISGVKIQFMPGVVVQVTAGPTALHVTADDVTVIGARYRVTASPPLTNGFWVAGNDCFLDNCKLEIDNPAQTVGDVYLVTGSRNYFNGTVLVTAVFYANSVTDVGALNSTNLRG